MADNRLGPIIEAAVNKLQSVAAASGHFNQVLPYEPKSNPGPGITFATWIGPIRPIALYSGLSATSARTLITCRSYLALLSEPQDTIDIRLAQASTHMMAELTGDFLEGTTWIDLLGAYGIVMETLPGYVPLDNAHYRIFDIPVPFISPDVFDQEA